LVMEVGGIGEIAVPRQRSNRRVRRELRLERRQGHPEKVHRGDYAGQCVDPGEALELAFGIGTQAVDQLEKQLFFVTRGARHDESSLETAVSTPRRPV